MSAETARLAVFDIDGTLTDTVAVDARCYAEALETVLGIPTRRVAEEWRHYRNITDSGIAAEAVERHLRRDVTEDEIDRLEAVFVEMLIEAFDGEPYSCRPVPGAVEFIGELGESEDWDVALATGGFRQSALLKLARAGFDPPAILATCGDATSRQDIVRAALSAVEGSTERPIDSQVLVGDGVWDVEASFRLGVPCVGVARGGVGEALLGRGAVAVLEDFSDRQHARRVLAEAADGGFVDPWAS